MKQFKELWKGQHISVISPIDQPYECVHEPNVIMVIPVIATKSKYINNFTNYYIGIRKEFCPPYLMKDDTQTDFYYTVISGRMDVEGETAEQTMKRELIEEAGIKLIDYRVIFERSNIPICKTTDMRATVYGLLVDTFEKVEAVGDGTKNEEMSSTIFIDMNKMEDILKKPNIDFLLVGMYSILMDNLRNYIEAQE